MRAYAVWNRRAADGGAQPLSGQGDRGQSAAGAARPPLPPRLHHPAEAAAADLRAVFGARRSFAGDLSALSGQRLARKLRSAGHADQAHPAGQGQSLCRKETRGADSRRLHELQQLAGAKIVELAGFRKARQAEVEDFLRDFFRRSAASSGLRRA